MKSLLLLLLLSFSMFGQMKNPKYVSLDLMYGQKFLNESFFHGQLNSIDALKYGGAISYVGVGVSTYILISRGPRFDHFGNMYYAQVIPQDIKINDTVISKLTGFNFGFTLYGFDFFPKQKVFNTYLSLGANTGRLRFYGNSRTNLKNAFFSPKIRIQPTLSLAFLRLSLHVEYDYDISNKNWKKIFFSKTENIHLDKTSVSGLNVLASIGYIFREKNKRAKKGGVKAG